MVSFFNDLTAGDPIADCAGVAAAGSAAPAQSSTGLGVLPGVPDSAARAVSGAGSTVVGYCGISGVAYNFAFRWTRGQG